MKNHTLTRLFTAVLLICLSCLAALAQDFAWMKGPNLLDQNGVYGTMGIAAAGNNPGARGDAIHWKDASGNLWMFGGFGLAASGIADNLSDLWKYNPATNQWTWMKGDNSGGQAGIYGTLGVAAPANKPGARAMGMGWTDNQGNLWLMGGYTLDAFWNMYWYNDLWKYSISTNEWTWMGGSNITDQNGVYGTQNVPSSLNVPGARYDAASWTDAAGNMWLFGGLGFDNTTPYPGILNDLWRYNPSANQWTWMGGTTLLDQNGIYGTLGVPAASNLPGGRYSGRGVADASGNFWLFGGFGYDAATNNAGELNDMWRYNTSTNQWTWINGSNMIDQLGTYGTLGQPAASNQPGGRESHHLWIDANATMWMFGGFGYVGSGQFANQVSDLWKYNLATNQWTWMKGPSTQTATGVYGTQGVSNPANIPGARKSAASWIDGANNLWLFGGIGYDNGIFGEFNDLWKGSFCVAAPVTVSSSQSSVCPGSPAVLTASGAVSYAWSTNQFTNSIVVSPTINTVYMVTGTDVNGCTNSATIGIQMAPTPTVFIGTTTFSLCSGKSVTLVASGANTYTWNGVQQGSFITATLTTSTIYTVQGTGSNGCKNTVTFMQTVAPLPTLSVSSTKSLICKGEPVAITVSGAASYSWHTASSNTGVTLLVTPTVSTTYSVTGTGNNGCKNITAFTQSVSNCTGIESHQTLADLKLYPNPNTGEFTISSSENEFQNDVFIISNTLGQIVFEQQISGRQIGVSTGLSTGVYHCQVLRSGVIIHTGKIIIR